MKYLYFLAAIIVFIASMVVAIYINKSLGFPIGLPVSILGGMAAGHLTAKGMFL